MATGLLEAVKTWPAEEIEAYGPRITSIDLLLKAMDALTLRIIRNVLRSAETVNYEEDFPVFYDGRRLGEAVLSLWDGPHPYMKLTPWCALDEFRKIRNDAPSRTIDGAIAVAIFALPSRDHIAGFFARGERSALMAALAVGPETVGVIKLREGRFTSEEISSGRALAAVATSPSFNTMTTLMLDEELVEDLKEYANARVRGGGTALHLCCRVLLPLQTEKRIAILINSFKIDPTLLDDRGFTAMHILKRRLDQTIADGTGMPMLDRMRSALRIMNAAAEPFLVERQHREAAIAMAFRETMPSELYRHIALSTRKA